MSPRFFVAYLDVEVNGSGEGPEDQSVINDAVGALRAAATRLTDGIRYCQPVVGIAGDVPPARAFTVVEIGTGREIPLGVPVNPSPPSAVGYPAFDRNALDRTLRGDIATPEILLAQAAYWVLWTASPKPGLAVVLAAMACESRVRQTLVERVEPGMAPLLSVVFDKPRVFQQPASDLFDHIAKAVLGRSLRKDDLELWNQIEQMFRLRNQMAHRANEPPAADCGSSGSRGIQGL